jgi:predicted ATP-dependent endonuclease of OLD family
MHSFRRFAEATINLDTPIVAIVGPNEAGKSSILAALAGMEARRPFPRSDRARAGDGDPSTEVHWILEPDDLAALQGVPGCEDVRYFVQHRTGEDLVTDVIPQPQRDKGLRKSALAVLDRLMSQRAWRQAVENDDEGELHGSAVRLRRILDSDVETLSEEDREFLGAVADYLGSVFQSVATGIRLADMVGALSAQEAEEHPRDVARDILSSRRSRIVEFDNEHRDLRPRYDLRDEVDDPSQALGNLCAAAGLDLRALLTAVDDGNQPLADEMVQRANARLGHTFRELWSQASLTVRLARDATLLSVIIEEEGLSFTDFGERSDGLRMFVALFAFVTRLDSDTKPVLLIDEAEQHLHYDAQADLMRVLTSQPGTAKVIYTTHSAGCLPEDMAASVRVVRQRDEPDTSEIRSGFWDDGYGFDPLLLAMGASTFAFSAARRAVLAEGAVEAILLPRMLREATDTQSLGFQIAPGLSQLKRSDFEEVDLVAARVAFTVDNDGGGADLRGHLLRAGVPADHIVVLQLARRTANTLEDFLDEQIYLDAVNSELDRSGKQTLSKIDIRGSLRPTLVAAACAANHEEPPNKGAVARRISELESDVSILAPSARRSLQVAAVSLRQVLKVEGRSPI